MPRMDFGARGSRATLQGNDEGHDERSFRPAIFASAFSPSLGGVEELVRQLALEQQAVGHDPLVVTMRWPKALPAHEVIENVPVSRYVFNVPERKWRHLAGFAARTLRTRSEIAAELRGHKTDLIHVQCVSGNGYYARLAAQRLGLPLVVTLQGELTMDSTRVYERSRVLPKLLRRLLLEADVVTACSRHTLREAEEFTGVELGERGSVIYNGVRLREFDEATPERRPRPYVLAIGRHVEQKGFDVLVRAFAALSSTERGDHQLVIAGDGPERGALERLSGELGVASDVEFVGRCNRTRTTALFRGCEFFVLPSRHEPMGIVNLEAMASGKAVVATRVGGVPEFVTDGVSGVLVEPSSPAALADGLRLMLSDSALRARMGTHGRAAAATFDWSEIAKAYSRTYTAASERLRDEAGRG